MSHRAITSRNYGLYAYVSVSVVLAIPVLLWPFLLVTGLEPAFGESISRNWLVSASITLLSAIVADSILSGTPSLKQAVVYMAWVVVGAAAISRVLQDFDEAFLLGLIFFMHALRPFRALWHGEACWWQWPAWLRDTAMALVIFLWLAFWPVTHGA